MKVKDLVEELSSYPQDADCIVVLNRIVCIRVDGIASPVGKKYTSLYVPTSLNLFEGTAEIHIEDYIEEDV